MVSFLIMQSPAEMNQQTKPTVKDATEYSERYWLAQITFSMKRDSCDLSSLMATALAFHLSTLLLMIRYFALVAHDKKREYFQLISML